MKDKSKTKIKAMLLLAGVAANAAFIGISYHRTQQQTQDIEENIAKVLNIGEFSADSFWLSNEDDFIAISGNGKDANGGDLGYVQANFNLSKESHAKLSKLVGTLIDVKATVKSTKFFESRAAMIFRTELLEYIKAENLRGEPIILSDGNTVFAENSKVFYISQPVVDKENGAVYFDAITLSPTQDKSNNRALWEHKRFSAELPNAELESDPSKIFNINPTVFKVDVLDYGTTHFNLSKNDAVKSSDLGIDL